MRGKDVEKCLLVFNAGITPAHAGKSAPSALPAPWAWDHPRTCGEKTQEVTKYKAYDILHA